MFNVQRKSLNLDKSILPSFDNDNIKSRDNEISLFDFKNLDENIDLCSLNSIPEKNTEKKDTSAADEDKSGEMDTNGDGKITQAEIDAYNEKQASIDEDKTAELDKNGDGKITQEEIDAYNAEHTSSSAANAVDDDNLTPEEKVKNERIAKLDKAGAEVYSKYQDMIDNLDPIDNLERGENVRDAIYTFMDGLSDEELTSFLNAYNFVNSEEGGKTELCCALFAELLQDDGTDIEYRTFERLSTILSNEDKRLIYDSINKKMDDSISRMTYHTSDNQDSRIPNKTNQNLFRQIYAEQMAAFQELLNNGDSSRMEKYIENKNKSFFEYDCGYSEGLHIYAPTGGIITGKDFPDDNWFTSIAFEGMYIPFEVILDAIIKNRLK